MLKRKIRDILKQYNRWLILSHEKPDGDSLGCCAALAHLAKRLSKEAVVACSDLPPEKYSFLLDNVDFRQIAALSDEMPDEDTLILCVDTSNIDRSVDGLDAYRAKRTVVNIDHHADNELYGDVNWVDARASATGEMIAALLLDSGWGIRPDEAEALYVALVTDNGRFSFASTSPESHLCAIELLKAGAIPSKIYEKLDATMSKNSLLLWGKIFNKIETFSNGLSAIFWASLQDFADTGTVREDTENIVNFLLRIQGVRIAAMCTETPGGLRVSVRTRAPFNAREIASAFGGGGHDLAAGCTICDELPAALRRVKAEMERHAIRNSGPR